MNLLRLLIEHLLEGIDVGLLFCGDKDAVVVHFRHPGLLEFIKRDILLFFRSEVIRVFGGIRECINLVEHQNHRFFGGTAYIRKCLVHHLDLLFELGMADIHHVHKDIRLSLHQVLT